MIYLDHAAFTPVESVASTAMSSALESSWGNPQSVHAAGRRARAALEQARVEIGEFLGCAPQELRLCANATQAVLLALEWAVASSTGAVVSTRLEHPAVLAAIQRVERAGREVRWLDLPAGELAAADVLTGASVIAISPLNHELGTTIDVARVRALAAEAWLVLDAVQAAGWLDLGPWLDARTFAIASSAKLGGPPGVAVLRAPLRRDDERLQPAGGLPWLAAIGLGSACAYRRPRRSDACANGRRLGARLLAGLRAAAPQLVRNGGASWLGPILAVTVPEIDGRSIETALDIRDVAIARTSACRQQSDEPSPVVAAAYPDEPWRARGSTRWSLGWSTTEAEIDAAVAAFADALPSLLDRRASPMATTGAEP